MRLLLKNLFSLAGFLFLALSAKSLAAPIVSCNNPIVSSTVGGGSVSAVVTCTLGSLSGVSTLTGSNIVTPTSLLLTSGTNTLTATLQPTITSSTILSISGTPLIGFLGLLTVPTSTVQFTYTATTTSSTPYGNYKSSTGAMAFNWSILTVLGTSNLVTSSVSNSTIEIDVPAPPTVVSCVSPAINATAGGGAFTVNVNCTVSASGSSFSSGATNYFSPSSLNFTNGSSTLTSTLSSLITSPDNSVTGITGAAGSGFTGSIQSIPATIRAQYTGTTSNTTPSGTYNSGTITYNWFVL